MKGKIILRYLRDAEAKQQSMKEQEHSAMEAREREKKTESRQEEKKEDLMVSLPPPSFRT